MKKRSIQFIIIAMLIGMATYFFMQQSSDNNEATFIVGTASGYAPFVSVNPSGEYEGFDIDVANQVAKTMGKRLEIKDLGSMTSLFMALDQGMIDAIIWGVSITQERVAKVAMIHYFGDEVTSYPLIFWKTVPENITSLADMQGKTVCVEPGSSQDAVISKNSGINIISVDKIDDALLQIQYGKADAAFVEPAIAKKFKNKYPEIQIVDIPLSLIDQVHGVGIVTKKNRGLLIQEIQNAVTVLKSTGVIEQFAQKWDIPS